MQATLGLEMLADSPIGELDAIIVPTSGGGMLSGVALAVSGGPGTYS